MSEKLSQNDRVSYSFGLKLNIGNYQSLDFHLSYSTDRREDETAEEAYERCRMFVETKSEEEYDRQKALCAHKL